LRINNQVFRKVEAMSKKKQLTTGAGQPVGYNQNALTAGSRGPILL